MYALYGRWFICVAGYISAVFSFRNAFTFEKGLNVIPTGCPRGVWVSWGAENVSSVCFGYLGVVVSRGIHKFPNARKMYYISNKVIFVKDNILI